MFYVIRFIGPRFKPVFYNIEVTEGAFVIYTNKYKIKQSHVVAEASFTSIRDKFYNIRGAVI